MTEPETTMSGDTPSTSRLLKSTVIALVVALVVLVVAVLPAEYGVDPTGVGRRLGLTQMGEIKVALAREAAADDAKEASTASASQPAVAPPFADSVWTDVTIVTLNPG